MENNKNSYLLSNTYYPSNTQIVHNSHILYNLHYLITPQQEKHENKHSRIVERYESE